jgi:3-hydroxyacyl-CoA dehydrogenase / enoyl-CoA hydratase / 3-hydroxybutyryl-CoA epimerase
MDFRVMTCRKLEAKCGERFNPAQLLLDMAAKGESFYGRFASGGHEKAA